MNTQAGLVYIICTSIFARHYFDKKLDNAFQQGLSLVVPLMLQATVAIYGRTKLHPPHTQGYWVSPLGWPFLYISSA